MIHLFIQLFIAIERIKMYVFDGGLKLYQMFLRWVTLFITVMLQLGVDGISDYKVAIKVTYHIDKQPLL